MTTRSLLRPTAFVDSPFGHDGKVARLAGGLNWFAAAMSIIAFIVLYRFKVDVLWVVIAGGLIGLAYSLL